MCGVIGIVGTTTVTDRLVDGLKRLEYRGYDSAGIAVASEGPHARSRAKGKIVNLESQLAKDNINGTMGIAHTRWATHGVPNVKNAHPHKAGRVSIVHNGIIENFAELRDALKNTEIESDTDTEIVAHIINEALDKGASPQEAFSQSLSQLNGAYAFVCMIEGAPNTLFCARSGSPLAIGVGQGEMYIGSDALALEKLTKELVYLEEGDWAILTPSAFTIFDEAHTEVTRETTHLAENTAETGKGNYPHYMLKEIYEQPVTIHQTLSHFVDAAEAPFTNLEGIDFSSFNRLFIVACGTAYYSGAVAKYWFEQISGIAVEIDIASEFRYRQPVLTSDTLFIAISQSGETADTLAALRYAKAQGLKTMTLVNVMTSTMAREADIALPINAGPEIGVASTKAFTSQLTALATLALAKAEQTGQISKDEITAHKQALLSLPSAVDKTLLLNKSIKDFAKTLSGSSSAFFLGRGVYYPIALEAALKVKEISYIHAEGFAAGELKHGPIALIEDGTPVIVLAGHDPLFDKTVSNMQSVSARGAEVCLVTDAKGKETAKDMADHILTLPDMAPFIAPIALTVIAQLMSYHIAVHLGKDVDQPRNLAKSVTVE
jgi:glucosamine--fructose-6-phosphate aminotransferase (isomerizing)